MIEIELRLFGDLKKYLDGYEIGSSYTMQLNDNSTIIDILALLFIPKKEIKIFLVNGRPTKLDSPLKDNDRVAIFPAIVGG